MVLAMGFLAMTPKAKAVPVKRDIELKSFRLAKETNSARNGKVTCAMGETIWKPCIWWRISFSSHRKTQIIWLKTGQRTWGDIFPKKTCRWATGTWGGAQRHWSAGIGNAQSPQGAGTSHLPERPSSKRLEMASGGEDAERTGNRCEVWRLLKN